MDYNCSETVQFFAIGPEQEEKVILVARVKMEECLNAQHPSFPSDITLKCIFPGQSTPTEGTEVIRSGKIN